MRDKNLKTLNNSGNKARYLPKYSAIVQNIQKQGIGVMGAFVIGFDNDNPSVVEDISAFIVNNNLYAAQISILTPLPGTRLRKRLETQKRLLDTEWDNYTFGDVNFAPKNMTAQELQKCLLQIYHRVYSPDVRFKRAKYFKDIYLNLCH